MQSANPLLTHISYFALLDAMLPFSAFAFTILILRVCTCQGTSHFFCFSACAYLSCHFMHSFFLFADYFNTRSLVALKFIFNEHVVAAPFCRMLRASIILIIYPFLYSFPLTNGGTLDHKCLNFLIITISVQFLYSTLTHKLCSLIESGNNLLSQSLTDLCTICFYIFNIVTF